MSAPRFEDPFPIDPELRQLLREIAQRQEAKLLRVPAMEPARALLEPGPVIRSTATGLVPAERELLRCFREEVAELLRTLALARLTQRAPTRRLAHAYDSPDRSVHLPHESDLWLRLDEEARNVRGELPDDVGALEILDVITTSGGARGTVALAAKAALRLVPSDNCRLYVAAEFVGSGSIDTAERALGELTHVSRSSAVRAYAFSWRALVAGRRGDFQGALLLSRSARELEPRPPHYTYNCLAYAVQGARDYDCRIESTKCDECSEPDSPALVDWLAAVYEQRAAGEWKPTVEGRILAARLARESGGVSTRVFHVFL